MKFLRGANPPACLTCLASLWIAVASASAATFTVTTTAPTGPGSLAQAVTDANASPGFDTIAFNIPGTGVRKIDVGGTPLPKITDPVLIDGYTQPGASPNTLTVGDNAVLLIQIAGNSGDRLVISGGGSTVRGLSVTGPGANANQAGNGIRLTAKGGNIVTGTFVGVQPDGTTGGNAGGILIECANNVIGDGSAAGRNLISGNNIGIFFGGGDAPQTTADLTNNLVRGNLIGPDPSGTKALANFDGIAIYPTNVQGTVIGGTSAGDGNVISGNGLAIRIGLAITSPTFPVPPGTGTPTGVAVQGNLIGTTADGQAKLASPILGAEGIRSCGRNILIGGLQPGAGNVIVSDRNSVILTVGARPADGNAVLSNTIYPAVAGRVSRGLYLATGFFSPQDGYNMLNDYGDADVGPNGLQNSPVISGVTSENVATTVTGGLNSAPSTVFTVQFFAQSSSFPPGTSLLGTETITTDQFGNAPFTFTFPVSTTSDQFITATATDPNGNTSQFSPQAGVAQLANLSTRVRIGTGENILIGGFIVQSSTPMKVLIRGLGPSTNVPGALTDPTLTLFDKNGSVIASNDNWREGQQQQEIQNSGIPPQYDSEAAIAATLNDGYYTAQLSGANGSTGVGLLEIYDFDRFAPGYGRLVNISTRGPVGSGDDVLIGGVIVRGDIVENVIVRAIGPDLSKSGLRNALQDPTLELRDDNGNLLAANDDWRSNQQDAINATGIPPGDDRDSAIVAALVPGQYTAVVRGKAGQTGLALIEFYNLNP